jgi:hypothetical protein
VQARFVQGETRDVRSNQAVSNRHRSGSTTHGGPYRRLRESNDANYNGSASTCRHVHHRGAQPAATAEATVAEATAESTASSETSAPTGDTTQDDVYPDVLTFNNSAWHYDAYNDVYWQSGVQYCATPEATDYETLGILVPGAYMTATANGDGTYTATVDRTGSIDGSSAETAPMVFPVNTPGYSAQPAPTAYSYEEASGHLEAGFIYVAVGIAEETMAMTPMAGG